MGFTNDAFWNAWFIIGNHTLTVRLISLLQSTQFSESLYETIILQFYSRSLVKIQNAQPRYGFYAPRNMCFVRVLSRVLCFGISISQLIGPWGSERILNKELYWDWSLTILVKGVPGYRLNLCCHMASLRQNGLCRILHVVWYDYVKSLVFWVTKMQQCPEYGGLSSWVKHDCLFVLACFAHAALTIGY